MLLLQLIGCAVAKRKMGPFMVVEPDGLEDSQASLGNGGKTRVQTIFEFENTVDPFGQGVVVTVACLAHAGTNMVPGK